MRDPKRIERILKLLEKLWKQYPDQRFGQLLGNYVFPSIHPDLQTWNREDDKTEAILEELTLVCGERTVCEECPLNPLEELDKLEDELRAPTSLKKRNPYKKGFHRSKQLDENHQQNVIKGRCPTLLLDQASWLHLLRSQRFRFKKKFLTLLCKANVGTDFWTRKIQSLQTYA